MPDFTKSQLTPRPRLIGGQPLRFSAYPQQAAQARQPAAPLGSGRLQNTSKLGNGTGSSWGFGQPTNATNGLSGLANTRPGQAGVGPGSLAQSIGASHPATPLDMSEFPSLSGNSQAQLQNNTATAANNNRIWQRQTQHTPVQRPGPQQSHTNAAQQPQQHIPSNQHPGSPSHDNDMFMGSSHLQGSLDDYRQAGGQGQQIPGGMRQPPGQSIDEFPPLGRNGTDGNDNDRGFGGFGAPSAFSNQHDGSTRPSLPAGFGNQPESTRSSSAVDRTMSPPSYAPSNNRSPADPSRPLGPGQGQGQNPTNNLTSLLSNFSSNPQRAAASNTNQQHHSDFEPPPPSTGDIPASQKPEDMSESDRYGLAGFLARIRSEDPMVAGLARGQDLTQLGLNLSSPDPLYPTWSGPFADPGSRPLQPNFSLPECYTVSNVHRVRDKLPGFSDETLFWIFYTQPQDILQELAAGELTNRNWRYHKHHQMWLTKDSTLPEPRRVSDDEELGSYVFFNQRGWEKVRQTDFLLQYAALAPAK